MNYLDNKFKCSGEYNKTKNKYFVILYGPPASGKTLARKLSAHIIKKYYEENLEEKYIYSTFIDTNVDKLTYDKIIKDENITVIEKLKKTVKEYFDENKIVLNNDNNVDILRGHIPEIVKRTIYPIYVKNRADSLSELMIFIASFLNKNIFFEIATADINYVNNLLYLLKWYGYIPIIVYPYTSNVNLLYKRSINRGITEGRFLPCDGSRSIKAAVDINIKVYNENIINDFHKKYDNCMIYRYNCEIDESYYENFKKFLFGNFDKYKLSFFKKKN